MKSSIAIVLIGLSLVIGIVIGIIIMAKIFVKPTINEIKATREMSKKHLDLYMLMNSWVELKQNGVYLSSYFEKKGYKRIAIYGMNYVGKTLLKELQNTSIEVVVGIDKSNVNIDSIKTIHPDEYKEQVDVIVVTPISFFDDIYEMMESRAKCPIESIEDIIFEAGHI